MAVSGFDDQAALLACAQGDQQALQRLYDAEASRMMALSLHMMGQRSVAEELVADTFVLVWKNAESYSVDRGSARAWIYSILRYRALGRLRQAGRPVTMPGGFAAFPIPSALAAAAPGSSQPDVLRALATLPENARQAIYLAFYKGFDFHRIAQRFETTPDDVRRALRDGLKALAVSGSGPLPGVSADESVALGEYTLGLLDTREIETIHDWLAGSDPVVREALHWEERFLAMTDLLAVVQPSAHVYFRIQARLGHESIPAPATLFRQPESRALHEPVIQSVVSAAKGLATGTQSAPANATTTPQSPARKAVDASIATSQAAGLLADPVTETSRSGLDLPVPESMADDRHKEGRGSVSRTSPVVADAVHPVADAKTLSPAPDPVSEPAAVPRVIVRSSRAWKFATVFFALVAALALAMQGMQPPPEPPVTIVRVAPTMAAILQPPGSSSTPGWMVTLDHERNLLFRPLVQTQVQKSTVVQLWLHPPGATAAVSLGVIDPNHSFTVPAAQAGAVAEGAMIEMTQEPAADAPAAAPNGPVLFIGQLVVFGAGNDLPAERL